MVIIWKLCKDQYVIIDLSKHVVNELLRCLCNYLILIIMIKNCTYLIRNYNYLDNHNKELNYHGL